MILGNAEVTPELVILCLVVIIILVAVFLALFRGDPGP